MNTLIWILVATLINGLIALIGIFSLWINDKSLNKIIKSLVAFSAGALLSGALFHLIPHALEHSHPDLVFGFVLIGFIVFFIIERFLHWHHCHEGRCDTHPVSYLILIGDGVHNFIDGIIIGISFVVSVPFGLLTTALILAHEIPQELGDFAVMVHGGFEKKKALFYNFLVQLTSVAGGLAAYLFARQAESITQYIIPLAAGGFIYIAASDLIPELHKEPSLKKSAVAFGFFITGILIMTGLKLLLG